MPNWKWNVPASREELLAVVQELIRPSGAPDPAAERAAIYGRVSRIPANATSLSMEVQPETAERHARAQGWAVAGLYLDPDQSGRNSRRAELQRLFRDIRAGRITVVVVPRLDRLYRNLESLLKVLRLLERYHVRLVSVAEQFDTDTPAGRVMLYLLGGMAEMFVRYTSEQTRAVKHHTAEKGLQNGSLTLGYCNGQCAECTDPQGPGYCSFVGGANRSKGRGRVPVPHPIDQHAVRLMACLYQQGYSDRDITAHINGNDFALPDGTIVHFRTRGIPGREPPGAFTPASVRILLQNPFHVGLIAEHERPPLEMEDDPENPERRSAKPPRRRHDFKNLYAGEHEPLYAVQLWQANMAKRQSKRTTPTSIRRPGRVYPLNGVGFCWECYEAGLEKPAGLRGVQDKSGRTCYRCATVHDNYKARSKRNKAGLEAATREAGVNVARETTELLDRHKVWLDGDKLHAQLAQLIARLSIAPAWHELIQAYYLSDLGLSEFERQGYNLRRALHRARQLFDLEQIDQAEFERRAQTISQELSRLKPSAHPDAAKIVPYLGDIPAFWKQLSGEEQRGILSALFSGIYVDRESRIRRVVARAPFDKLLGLPEDGILLPGMLD